MKSKIITSAAASVLLLSVAPGFAQMAYNDWNTDGAAGINQQEWNDGWGRSGTFDRFDGNSDGIVDQNEINAGFADDNRSAFNDRFGSDYYNSWDADGDGGLSETEWNDGVYGGYDRDGSGMIEESEFGDVGDDMGDDGFWDL